MVSRRALPRKSGEGEGRERLQVAFVRHGERGVSSLDPDLTSAGRRMSAETGRWLAERGLRPHLALTTPTARTRQTLEEILGVIGQTPVEVHGDLPETRYDWDTLVDPLAKRLGDAGTLLLIGHHPTLHFLVDCFGPPPHPVPRHHFAAALILGPTRGGWRVEASWPGRAG